MNRNKDLDGKDNRDIQDEQPILTGIYEITLRFDGIVLLELDFKDVSSKQDLFGTGVKDLRRYRMNS